MIANYHTHTWRCNHASGAETDYAENAIARGIKILGFSDHTPYIFPGSYYSGFRMKMDQLDDYIQTVQSIKEHYSSQMQVFTGLEAEYYPRLFPDLLCILRDKPIDYLILGQHFTGNEIDGVYSGNPTDDIDDLKKYCIQVMDAMNTGLFSYVAHPDLIHFKGDQSQHKYWMRQICQESQKTGIPLEFNFLGLETGRHYPSSLFLEIAAEEQCPMVFGCDAHNPESLLNLPTENQAKLILKEYGISLLDTVPLLPIK